MNPNSWYARLARREVCASCSDPPDAGHVHCAYHRERHALRARAAWQERRKRLGLSFKVIVVPPARPRARPVTCRICASSEHGTRSCGTPAAKRRRALIKARDRQKREDRRYAAGLCVQCEDPREPGNTYRRCRACRQYHAAAVGRAKKANDTKEAA